MNKMGTFSTPLVIALVIGGAALDLQAQVVDPDRSSPGAVSRYESIGDHRLTIALYKNAGADLALAALVEMKGAINFTSKGIVSGVEGFLRLQLAEAKDQWVPIAKRELVDGRAIVTTEDGKSYTIFNLGVGAFAGQIEYGVTPTTRNTADRDDTPIVIEASSVVPTEPKWLDDDTVVYTRCWPIRVSPTQYLPGSVFHSKYILATKQEHDKRSANLILDQAKEGEYGDLSRDRRLAVFTGRTGSLVIGQGMRDLLSRITKVDRSTSKAQVLFSSQEVIEGTSLSADGTVVVFAMGGNLWQLNIADPRHDHGLLRTPADALLDTKAGESKPQILLESKDKKHFPCYSPEGNTVYYIGETSHGADVFALDMLSHKVVQISKHLNPVASCSVSPDGRYLALATTNGLSTVSPHAGTIWLLDIETGEARRLSDGTTDQNPSFSPNGKRIAFQRQNGRYENSQMESFNVLIIQPDLTSEHIRSSSRPADGVAIGGDRHSLEVVQKPLAEGLPRSTAPTTRESNSSAEQVLERICAEPGDRVDHQAEPKCSLSSVPASKAPERFEGQIMGFINWPKNYQPATVSSYGADDKNRIIVDGISYTQMPASIGIGEGGGFRCIGKFLVDKSLNPLDGIRIWDGKKVGALHAIVGNLTMFEYEFHSDETSPLVFKLTPKGYVFVGGKGTVTDLKTGATYTFPNGKKETLTGAGAGAREDGEQLRQAASEGKVARVKDLLDRGVAVDSGSEKGVTPLMLACAEGQVDVVKLLLARGANANAKDSNDRTALRWADLVRLPPQPQKDSSGMIAIIDEKGEGKKEIKAILKEQGKLLSPDNKEVSLQSDISYLSPATQSSQEMTAGIDTHLSATAPSERGRMGTPGEQAAWVPQTDSKSREAYEAYVRGNTEADPEKRIRCFSEAIQLDSMYTVAYFARGHVYESTRDYRHAVPDYTKAIELRPNYGEAYNNRAWSLIWLNELDRAIADAHKAIELKPGDATPRVTRGVAYLCKKDYDHAMEDYNKAIQLEPTNHQAFAWRGYTRGAKGHLDRAISDLNQAILLDHSYADAFKWRAVVYGMKGDLDAALDDLEQCVTLNPKDCEAYVNRGKVYSQKGDREGQIRECTRAIGLNSAYAPAYEVRGQGYAAKGEYGKAWEDVRTCRSLRYPVDPKFIETLKRVSGNLAPAGE